jgi:hypothetical protein
MLRLADETDGLSNEINEREPVPAIASTVIAITALTDREGVVDRQFTEVEELHAAVKQLPTDAMLAVAVRSVTEKLSPVTVTDHCPDMTTFVDVYDATGASKLISETPVPATAATVRAKAESKCALAPDRQLTDVEVVHDVVPQSTCDMCTD